MAVRVTLGAVLRKHTGGAAEVQASGSTLGEVLADLEVRYPGLTSRVRSGEGLSRFVNVYVNDEDVRHLGGLEAAIVDGDTVSLIPAVAGG